MFTRLISVKLCRNPTNFIHNQRRTVTDLTVTISPLTHLMGSFRGTQMAEQALLFCHENLHLPWWLSILGITLAVKTVLLPPNLVAIRSASKLPYIYALMEPKLKTIKHEIRVKGEEKNFSKKKIEYIYRKTVNDAYREAYIKNNCHPAKPYPIFALQIPIWLSVTYALRNLASSSGNGSAMFYLEQKRMISELPLDFGDHGFLWIPSFSIPDPYFILPALLFVVQLCSFQLKMADILMASDKVKLDRRPMGLVVQVLSLAWIPVMCYFCALVPSGVGIYWLFSAVIQFCFSLLLKYPTPRKFLKILPSQLEEKNPRPLTTFFQSFGRIFKKKHN